MNRRIYVTNKNVEIRLSGHSAYKIKYHMVWILKYRYRILKPGVRGYLRELFSKITKNKSNED
jgi:putative transposase